MYTTIVTVLMLVFIALFVSALISGSKNLDEAEQALKLEVAKHRTTDSKYKKLIERVYGKQ